MKFDAAKHKMIQQISTPISIRRNALTQNTESEKRNHTEIDAMDLCEYKKNNNKIDITVNK